MHMEAIEVYLSGQNYPIAQDRSIKASIVLSGDRDSRIFYIIYHQSLIKSLLNLRVNVISFY